MRCKYAFLLVLLVLSLAAGCGDPGTAATFPAPKSPQATSTSEQGASSTPEAPSSSPTCPPPDGEGSVSPAVSITSILFVVEGVEQLVRDGEALQASPGDEVRVKEATFCAGAFSGDGGEACVDLVPVDGSGREVLSEHGGTHLGRVTSGLVTTSGPDRSWIIDENWTQFTAVLNHWPPESTADTTCAEGRCERDDWMTVPLQ